MNARSFPPIIHPAKTNLLAQIQALESQIAQLTEEKAACQYQIDQYYRLFQLHLGDLLTQTLELQLQLALRRAGQTGRRSDAEEAQACQDKFEQTNRAVREAVAHQPTDPDEAAERELRRLYRQAVTLAHPDRHASDSDRNAQATAYMMRLNDAYQRRDLAAVRQLVQDLNDGFLFSAQPKTAFDLDALQQWHQRLIDRQHILQTEIAHLKADNGYRLMIDGTDLMTYFMGLRESMQQQINLLKHQLKSV
ncbi:J domain-containing protein [Spirosoma taeanense]|uniref:J domain-containing protein n=1 Tax=Spirosoma taeanense TaxID=2735870 RepID=A0A6M5YC41_9BACT|nr:J domain-containing protein [Spirosoma taeanense]QJW91615.1 J domain-containing protein [Spirosoma taeanense]